MTYNKLSSLIKKEACDAAEIKAWDVARESKATLEACNTPQLRRQIMRTAAATGFGDVWITVFQDDEDMRNNLLGIFA